MGLVGQSDFFALSVHSKIKVYYKFLWLSKAHAPLRRPKKKEYTPFSWHVPSGGRGGGGWRQVLVRDPSVRYCSIIHACYDRGIPFLSKMVSE